MGIEDFRTTSSVSQEVSNNKSQGSQHCPYGLSGANLEEVREEIDRWLKDNNDRCYISPKHVSEALDISQSKIGYSLNNTDCIDSWAGESSYYINPYSEIGELD